MKDEGQVAADNVESHSIHSRAVSHADEKNVATSDDLMPAEEKYEVPATATPEDVEKQDEALQPMTTTASQLPMSKARTIALVITLTGAAFLNTLSVQAAVIVLPTIGRELNIPTARQQWIVSAYSLAFGCFLLLWGRLADVYGKRAIFIWGSAWVSVVTLVCPFVPSEIGFDVFRGLQGLGAAANVPTAIGILGVTFAPGKAKNYAFATYSAGAPMGSVFGNILGGVVAEYASWKWIFWILAMIAALVTVAGHFVIPLPATHPSEEDVKNAVDWVGGSTITIALFALLFALTEGNTVNWRPPYIFVIIALSFVLIIAFVFWQLYLEKKTTRRPLVKMSIFKNHKVAAAMFLMAVFFAAFNNFLIFATYYFQDYHGFTAIETTVRFLPTGVVGVITAFVTSQILARIKINYILMFGTLCIAITCLLFAIPISPDTSYWAYGFPAMCLCVFGADTLFPSLILFVTSSLPREDQSLGGAIINAVGQVGRAIGLALATAIQIAVDNKHDGVCCNAAVGEDTRGNSAFLQGLRAAQWFSTAIALCAVVVATFAFKGVGIIGLKK